MPDFRVLVTGETGETHAILFSFMFNPLIQKEKKFSLKKFIKKLPWGILMCFLVNILAVVLCTYVAYKDVNNPNIQ